MQRSARAGTASCAAALERGRSTRAKWRASLLLPRAAGAYPRAPFKSEMSIEHGPVCDRRAAVIAHRIADQSARRACRALWRERASSLVTRVVSLGAPPHVREKGPLVSRAERRTRSGLPVERFSRSAEQRGARQVDLEDAPRGIERAVPDGREVVEIRVARRSTPRGAPVPLGARGSASRARPDGRGDRGCSARDPASPVAAATRLAAVSSFSSSRISSSLDISRGLAPVRSWRPPARRPRRQARWREEPACSRRSRDQAAPRPARVAGRFRQPRAHLVVAKDRGRGEHRSPRAHAVPNRRAVDRRRSEEDSPRSPRG